MGLLTVVWLWLGLQKVLYTEFPFPRSTAPRDHSRPRRANDGPFRRVSIDFHFLFVAPVIPSRPPPSSLAPASDPGRHAPPRPSTTTGDHSSAHPHDNHLPSDSGLSRIRRRSGTLATAPAISPPLRRPPSLRAADIRNHGDELIPSFRPGHMLLPFLPRLDTSTPSHVITFQLVADWYDCSGSRRPSSALDPSSPRMWCRPAQQYAFLFHFLKIRIVG
jgi:hypothetical protein